MIISQGGDAGAFSARQKVVLSQVQTYLNGIRTMKSEFIQVSPDGSVASGKFYLKRPGRLRWEYDPPTPLLIVADGKFVNIHDKELDEVSKLPISSTLVSFLAQETISFGPPARVTDISEGPGTVRITVTQADRSAEGSLTLVLSSKPMVLQKMVVKDAVGKTTSVTFNEAVFDNTLDARLFIFQDPHNLKRRTKK